MYHSFRLRVLAFRPPRIPGKQIRDPARRGKVKNTPSGDRGALKAAQESRGSSRKTLLAEHGRKIGTALVPQGTAEGIEDDANGRFTGGISAS